ncbi:Crp/Fnr family transcriptional regulator [Noviherbaspirillum galbum]|uniref:Cyclic nucleotide-binding domain-containing protein n=1 Tax=Noviherbaspirillum galbum TaxID=2709383 RepID=A0A6B3SU14_9BURK|nr:cyclic nucleotide-binding domain-containing protein [Noviherbaspirillum galbum]NEX64293.1 cyclic nucleotide-binding domain-containing protein [Noviherbaspirillum galbum]
MSVQCDPHIMQLLLRLDLFRGMTEAELGLILEASCLVEFASGEYAIREGEQDHHVFVLLSGKARIVKRAIAIQKVIQDLGPGECFGEMSLIDCRSRSASVKAVGACKTLRISGDALTALPDVSAKVYRNIACKLSQRLRHANDLLTLG